MKFSSNIYIEPKETHLSPFFGLAFFAHAVLIAVALYLPKIFTPDVSDLNLVQVASTVRVDIVEMPNLTLKELKNLEQSPPEELPEESAPPAKAERVPEEAPSKEDFKEVGKKTSFLDRLNKLSQQKVNEKKIDPKKEKKWDQEELKKLVYAGNKLSAGVAVEGTTGEGELSEVIVYGQSIATKVKQFWRLPGYLKDLELSNKVQVFVDRNGKLMRTRLVESSGNPQYDNRAIKAIKDAAPFGSPNSEIASSIIKSGIILAFPL